MIIFCNSDSTHISDKITDLFSYLTKDTIAKEMRESAYEEVAEYFDDLYLWKEYFEAFPNSSDAFYGLINHSDANFDEIVNSYEKFLKFYPENYRAILQLAYLSGETDLDKARKHFEQAKIIIFDNKITPNFFSYRLLSILYYELYNDKDNAKKSLALAIEDSDNLSDITQLNKYLEETNETFISELYIKNVRHHRELSIPLSEKNKKHLFLTGKTAAVKPAY